MNKPFGRMLSAFLVFMVLVTGTVFVEGIKVEAASYKSINLEGWKKYLRGGQYAGGFTMKAAYQEEYSSLSSTKWKLSDRQTTIRVSDGTLSVKFGAYTKLYDNGAQKHHSTLSSSCDYIGIGGQSATCKRNATDYTLTKNKSRTDHTSNVTLGSNYFPSVHYLKKSYSY
ncbi:hypothetical protein QRD90_23030 [Peribacillus frigoritolerans]|uniref:hypothetical protein n=1 Tax=Peribacillus TaxID=2675229 RepID=UPI00207B0670|nr:hypothetical protein [Peribacillus frigoritolerans]QYF83866.1 hypothetical protein KY492_06355 [Brevibacterium sp. PAMC21349]USK79748.1 hypothetical protein LHV56_23480 [Peribacillus frigoritolerans]WJE47038.1 hypothetical protein QRD90_23030 [Peribacillus frigoritolerans]